MNLRIAGALVGIALAATACGGGLSDSSKGPGLSSTSQSSSIGSEALVLSVGDCVTFTTTVPIDDASKRISCSNPDAPYGYYQVESVHSSSESKGLRDSLCSSRYAEYYPHRADYSTPVTYCLVYRSVNSAPVQPSTPTSSPTYPALTVCDTPGLPACSKD
jgi:hypothetical protein